MPPSQKEDVVNPVAPPFSYNIPPSMMDNLSPYDATKTINVRLIKLHIFLSLDKITFFD